jgi:peptide/nickel transport system substrate-binding protein
LRPDGDRISFEIMLAIDNNPGLAEGSELVCQYWGEVGIDCQPLVLERGLVQTRADANEHDVHVFPGQGGLNEEVLIPNYYLPFAGNTRWAPLWGAWFVSRGAEGEEPPEATRRQMELYWELETTADEDERDRLFREILTIAKEEFYVIGTVFLPEIIGVVNNDFHNVPRQMMKSDRFNSPAPYNPEQFFTA